MKKVLCLLMALTFIASCKKDKEKEYATLSGKVINIELDSIRLRNWTGFIKTIKVKEDGTFSDTLKVADNNNIFTLILRRRDNKSTLYLKNGYDLNLTITSEGYEKTTSFSGHGAAPNNYLHIKQQNINLVKGENLFAFMDLKEDEFAKNIEAIKSSNLKSLNGAPVDEEFRSFEKENIKYDALFDYRLYFLNMKRKTAQPGNGMLKEYIAPKGFMPSELFDLKMDNEQLYKNSSSYRSLTMGILKSDFIKKFTENKVSVSYLDSLFDKAGISALKNSIVLGLRWRLLDESKMPEAKTYYDYLMDHNDLTAKTKNKLKEFYSSQNTGNGNKKNTGGAFKDGFAMLKKGAASPKFNSYVNYAGGTTSLDDLKGKYVYIDVWATWCGPCKKEIPSLKELEKKYHGKNISFVSISVDEAYGFKSWQKMVKEKELTGIQLFADNAFKSQFIKDYGIKGIPRFILIDPEGKVVDAKAPRPSNPKLIELFDELNI